MGLLRMNTEAATEPIRNNLVSIFQQLLQLQDTGWKPLPQALHMKGYAEFRAKPSYSEELFVGLRGPERPAILHYVSLTTDAGPAPQHVIIKQSGVGNRHTTIKHAQDTRDLLTNIISGCANHTVPNAGVSADNALDRAHAAAEPGPKVVDAFQDILRTGPHTWKSIGHGLEFEVFYQSGAPDSNLRHLSIRCVQDPMVQFSFFRSIGFGGLHIVSASLNIDHYIPEPDDVDARGLLQYIVKVCVQQLRKHGKQNLVQAAAEPHAAQPASVFLNKMAEHPTKRTITYRGVHFNIETNGFRHARLYVNEGTYGSAYVVVQDHNVSVEEYEHGSRVLVENDTLNSVNRSKTLHVIDTALNAEDLLRQVIEFAYKRRPGATASAEPPVSNAAGYWLAQIVGRKLEREIRVGGRKGTIRCERRVGFLTVTMSGYGGVYNVVWQRTLEPQRAYDVAVVITDGDHASSSHGRILTVIEHASSVRDLLRQVLEFVATNERRRGNVEAAAEPAPESAIAQGYLRAFTSVLQHMLKSPKQVIDTEVQGTNGSRYKVTFRLTQQRFGNRDTDDISTNWQLSMTSTSFATSKQAYAGCVGTMYPARGPSPYFHVKGRQIDLEFADRKDLPSQPSQVFPFLAKVFLSKLVGAERIQAAAEPQAQERSGYIRVHLDQDQIQNFETRVKKIPGVIWKGILHENWALLELVSDLDHTLPMIVELARALEARHLMVPGGVGKLFLPRYTPQLLQAVRNSHESLRANAASEPGSDLKQAFTEMVDHFEYGGSLGHLTEPGKNLIRHAGFDYMVWCHKNALRLWIRVYKTPVGSDNEAHRYPYVVDYDPDPQRVVVCRTPSMNGGSGIYRDVVLEITDSMTSKQLIRTVLAAVVSDTRKRAGKPAPGSAVAAAEPAPKPVRGRLTISFGANRKNVLAFAAALKKQFPDVETSKEAKNIAGVQGKRAQYWYTVYPKLDPKLVQAILQLANTNGATEAFSASNSWTMSGLMNTPELASSLFRAMQGTIHEQWAQAASEPQETRNFTEELEKLALSYSNSRSGTWVTPHFLCDGFARAFVLDGGHAHHKLQSYTIYVDFTATTEAKVDHPRTRYKFQASLTYGRDERKPEPEMRLREVAVDTKHPIHREPRNVDVSELSPRDLLRRAVSDACLYVRENAKRLLEEIATEDPKFKNVSVTAAAEPEPQVKLEDIFNQLRDRTQVSRRDAQIDEYKSIAYDGIQVVLRNAHGADSNILFINSELPNQEWTSGTADFERGVVTLAFSNNVRAVRHLEIQEGDVHSSQELLRKIVAWYVGLHKKYVAQAGKKVQAASEPQPPSTLEALFNQLTSSTTSRAKPFTCLGKSVLVRYEKENEYLRFTPQSGFAEHGSELSAFMYQIFDTSKFALEIEYSFGSQGVIHKIQHATSVPDLLTQVMAEWDKLLKGRDAFRRYCRGGDGTTAAAEPAPNPSSNQSAFYDFADTLPDYRRGVPGKRIQTKGVTLDIVYDDMVSCVCVKVSRPGQDPRYVVAHFDHSLKKSQFMVLKDEHGVAIPNTAKNVDADSARSVLQKLIAYCLDNYPGVAEAAAEPKTHQDVVSLFRDIVVSIKPHLAPGISIAGLQFWRNNGKVFMCLKGNGQYAAIAVENSDSTSVICSFAYGGWRVHKYTLEISSATSPKELLQQIITWYRTSVKQRETDEGSVTSAAEPNTGSGLNHHFSALLRQLPDARQRDSKRTLIHGYDVAVHRSIGNGSDIVAVAFERGSGDRIAVAAAVLEHVKANTFLGIEHDRYEVCIVDSSGHDIGRILIASSPRDLLNQFMAEVVRILKVLQKPTQAAAEPELDPIQNPNQVLDLLLHESRFRVRGVEIQVTPVPARTGTEWRLKVLNRPEHAGDEYLASIGFDHGKGQGTYDLACSSNMAPYRTIAPYRTMLTVPLTEIP